MPTTLPRVKPTVAKEINKILFQLAKRDQMSVSAKTLELLKQAIEIEENITLIKL
ncbi:TPA: toxin-antitoxin system, antitoxin component, partial [Candidatus Uhrbacteria bacterium]|nr:toxin-antitoxin system, antitoxin component [Candidatus Uhrbacteria bacterium]